MIRNESMTGLDRRWFMIIMIIIMTLVFAVTFWYVDITQQRLTKEKEMAVEFVQQLAVRNDEMFSGVEGYVKCECFGPDSESCNAANSQSLFAIEKFQSKRTENAVLTAANFGANSDILEALSTAPSELRNVHQRLEKHASATNCAEAQSDIDRLRLKIERLLISSVK